MQLNRTAARVPGRCFTLNILKIYLFVLWYLSNPGTCLIKPRHTCTAYTTLLLFYFVCNVVTQLERWADRFFSSNTTHTTYCAADPVLTCTWQINLKTEEKNWNWVRPVTGAGDRDCVALKLRTFCSLNLNVSMAEHSAKLLSVICSYVDLVIQRNSTAALRQLLAFFFCQLKKDKQEDI